MNTTTEVEIVAPARPGDPHMKQVVVWDDFRNEANRLKATAETLTVTNVTQVAEMKLARATRLTIKNLRVAITKKHTELKASVLEEGRKIDAGKNELLKILEPLEDRLLLQENFAEREAARIKAEKHLARVNQLNPYLSSPVIIDLAEMSEEDFQAQLASAKDIHENRLAQLKREQEAREEAVRQEQQRIAAQRIENERLRIESERLSRELAEQKRLADEAAARAKIEREAAEAKARAEREAIAASQRAALEAAAAVAKKAEDERKALQARIDAEEFERKAKEAAEEKAKQAALLAPDKEKIEAYAMALWEVPQPKVSSKQGSEAVLDIRRNLERFIAYIESLQQTGKRSGSRYPAKS